MLLSNLFFIRFLRLTAGLGRTSTYSSSWIYKSLVPVLRLMVSVSDVCSTNTKAIDENYKVHDDYKDGNEGFKDPGRRGCRRPEEPWYTVSISWCADNISTKSLMLLKRRVLYFKKLIGFNALEMRLVHSESSKTKAVTIIFMTECWNWW